MNDKTELTNIYAEIQLLKEKITFLEKDNYNMNQILSKELDKTKNKGNNSLPSEINILKKRQDQFEGAMIRDFSKFKDEIINDINTYNSNLMQNVENLISQYNNSANVHKDNNELNQEEDNSENENDIKKNNDKDKNDRNIGNELFKDNSNYNKLNYSIDSIKSNYLVQKEKEKHIQKIKSNSLDEVLSNEFSQYRSELNKNAIKLSLIEKKYNGLSTQYFTEVKNINNDIKSLKDYQQNFEEFQNNTILNLNNFKDDFAHNVENNKLFISEISKIIEDFQIKLNHFEKNNNRINEQYSLAKNDIDEALNNLVQKLNKEMNEFHKSINNQISEQGKEIDNFEKFLSEEHGKFIQFIQNHLDESISSIKKLFDFNGDDIKKLNKKIEIIHEIIKKVRNDVFKSINDSEQFLENKYQSLFRLINKE
jgi:hypothetical protein